MAGLPATRRERRAARVERARRRALELLAFRLFGAMLPFALLLTVLVGGGIGRFRRPLPAAVALIATVVAAGTVMGVSWLVPHGGAPWTALVPGSLLVALGVQVIDLGTRPVLAVRHQPGDRRVGDAQRDAVGAASRSAGGGPQRSVRTR